VLKWIDGSHDQVSNATLVSFFMNLLDFFQERILLHMLQIECFYVDEQVPHVINYAPFHDNLALIDEFTFFFVANYVNVHLDSFKF
jgi:hypothetical protein